METNSLFRVGRYTDAHFGARYAAGGRCAGTQLLRLCPESRLERVGTISEKKTCIDSTVQRISLIAVATGGTLGVRGTIHQ
jgi:hypothetical protein